MPYASLEDFAHRHRHNFTPNHIKRHLLSLGHNKRDVEKALRKAYKDVLEKTVDQYIHTHTREQLKKELELIGHHPRDIEKAISKAIIKYAVINRHNPQHVKDYFAGKGHPKGKIKRYLERVHSPHMSVIRPTLIWVVLLIIVVAGSFLFTLKGNKLCSNEYYNTTVNSGLIELNFYGSINLKRSIRLEGNSALDKISDLKCIQKLDLSNTNLTDISALAKLRDLRHLILSNTRIGDFSVLSKFRNLGLLDASESSFNNINVISSLKDLTFLRLSSTRIKSIDGISSMKRLQALDIASTDVADISELSQLNITYLVLRDTKVTNITALADSSLETIDVGGLKLADYSPLYEINSLKRVTFTSPKQTIAIKQECERLKERRPSLVISGC